MCAKSLQSCPILCNLIDHGLPGSSVHGILQARILEWVAISFSRGSSWPRDRTLISCISCIDRWVLYHRHHLGSPEIRHNFWNLELFLKKRCLLILFVCLLILKANIGQQKINTAFWQNYVTKGMKSFPGGSVIKICLPMQEIQITWEIPWTEEPGRQQSTGLQKSQTWLSNQTTNGQK